VVSVGEVDPVTKNCISDTIFRFFTNGNTISNFHSVVFSRYFWLMNSFCM